MSRDRLWRQKPNGYEEPDPMAGMGNLLDIMLVFSCGLMVALIVSWRLQGVMFNQDLAAQQKKQMMQAAQKMVKVEKGRRLEQMPEISRQSASGTGYNEMGTVFRDPRGG